jgi:hypothetical protein
MRTILAARPTTDMVRFFEKRTREHIDRVVRSLHVLADCNADIRVDLLERTRTHDQSKWAGAEREPYIWITHEYRCKNEGRPHEPQPDPDMKKQIGAAIQNHYKANSHHPEFHATLHDMGRADLAEMVADWAAMAEEYGNDSPRGWADDNVGSRWKFNDDQVAAIYEFIGQVEAGSRLAK